MRHLNPQEKDPQRIKKDDKQFIEKLDYTDIIFPESQKQYKKLRNITALESMYLLMKKSNHTRLIFPKRRSKTK